MKVPTDTRALVLSRDGSKCARCGTGVGNIPSSVHHRRPRGMGGTRDIRSIDPRNLVLVCGTGTTGCHHEIESNRAQAYEDGWLLRTYDDLNEPMVATDGHRIYLDDVGGRIDGATRAPLRGLS